MTTSQKKSEWESGLGELLELLTETQEELLSILDTKRELLLADDNKGLQAVQEREQMLIERLQECQQKRSQLLEQAAAKGLPSNNIRSLVQALPKEEGQLLMATVETASSKARLLQHHCLSNWVMVQRTLLHLNQMLEIIATGSRKTSTYGSPESKKLRGGAFMDKSA